MGLTQDDVQSAQAEAREADEQRVRDQEEARSESGENRPGYGDPSKHLVPQAATMHDPVYFQNSDGFVTAVEAESDMYFRFNRQSEWRRVEFNPDSNGEVITRDGPAPEGERFSVAQAEGSDHPLAQSYESSTYGPPAKTEDQRELDQLNQPNFHSSTASPESDNGTSTESGSDVPSGEPSEDWTVSQLDAYAEREGVSDYPKSGSKSDKLAAL